MIKYEIIQSLSNEDYIVSESMLSYIDSLLQLNEKASMYQENYEGAIDSINISHLFLEADSSNNKNKNFIEKIWDAIKEAWEAIINFLTGNSNKDKDTQKKLAEAKNVNPNAVKDMKSKLSSTSGESSNEVKTSPDGKKYIPLVGVSLAGVLGAGYGISLKLKNKKNTTTEPDNQPTNQPETETNGEEETVVAVVTNNDGSEITKEKLDEILKEERDNTKKILMEQLKISDRIFEISDDFTITIHSAVNYLNINETLLLLISEFDELADLFKNATDDSSFAEMKSHTSKIKTLQSKLILLQDKSNIDNHTLYSFEKYSTERDMFIDNLQKYVHASDSLRKEWANYLAQQNSALKADNERLSKENEFYKFENNRIGNTVNENQNSDDTLIQIQHPNGTTTTLTLGDYKKIAEARISELREKIKELQEKNKTLESSTARDREVYNQTMNNTTRELEELKKNIIALENNKNANAKKIGEIKVENEEMSKKIKELSNENQNLKSANSRLQSENAYKDRAIQEKDSKIEQLTKKMEEIVNGQRAIQAKAQSTITSDKVVTASASEIVNKLQSPGEKLTPLNGSPYKQNTSSTPTTSATKYDNTAIFNAITNESFAYVKLQRSFDHSLFYVNMLDAGYKPQVGYYWMTADNTENASVVRIYPLLELNDNGEIGNKGSHLSNAYHNSEVFASKTTSDMYGSNFKKINTETLKPAIFIRDGDEYKLDKMGNFDVL